MKTSGYVVGYKDINGEFSLTCPLKLMTMEQAETIMAAKQIEYPKSAEDYAIFEISLFRAAPAVEAA